jgi:hypothetical protein
MEQPRNHDNYIKMDLRGILCQSVQPAHALRYGEGFLMC